MIASIFFTSIDSPFKLISNFGRFGGDTTKISLEKFSFDVTAITFMFKFVDAGTEDPLIYLK